MLVQWLWWTFREDFWKLFDSGYLHIPKPRATANSNIVKNLQKDTGGNECQDMQLMDLRLASYNVQTINNKSTKDAKDKPGSPSKIAILVNMMVKNEVRIFGLQETRLRRNLPKNDDYYIFQTMASSKGNGGILIGISKKMPIFPALGKQGLIQEENVKISHGDEELLILRIQSPNMKAMVICGHAPHSGYLDGEIRGWWRTLQSKLERLGEGFEKIFLLDANGRVGSEASEYVGTYQQENETLGGSELHDTVRQSHTWIPATFETHQCGPGYTWRHPTGKPGRIDFIAIPTIWQHLEIQTRVAPELSISVSEYDHYPIFLEVYGMTARWETRTPTSFGHRIGRIDCTKKETNEQLKGSFGQLSQLPWDEDVHTHVDRFTDHIFRSVRTLPQGSRQVRGRKTHLSEETWQWIEQKKRWRKEYFESKENLRLGLLLKIWNGWRHQRPMEDDWFENKEMRWRHGISELQMKAATMEVKRRIREEDDKFFESFGSKMEAADTLQNQRDLWREVRRYMPKAQAKKKNQDPKKISQLEDKWSPHICKTEAGTEMALQDIYANCIQRQNGAQKSSIDIGDLPTLLETEVALRKAKTNKASGPDGISADWLHHFAHELAPVSWQLLFKTQLWCTEPIQHKGGSLCMLYKKGQIYNPASCRAIMLMSTLGKQLHSTTRPKIMRILEEQRRPGQIGGFPGMEPSFGSLYMRTLQRAAFAKQRCCALIFFDLKMAFHGLIREGIYGPDGTEPEVIKKLYKHLQDMGLPADEIMINATKGGFLREIQAPESLTKLLQEYGSNNWAEIQGHVIQTDKGSRPGSPLADCLFHVQMCEMSGHIAAAIQEESSSVALCQEMGFENEAIYWADDLCIGVIAKDCDGLDTAVQKITTRVQQIFAQRGFETNFARGKTEVLLTYKGREAPDFRRRLLGGERTGFDIPTSPNNNEHLRIGAIYRHLGAMQESGGSMDAEIQHRCQQTWEAWRTLRKNVLCTRKLSQKTRLRLCESLLFSKLFHASGSWPVLTRRQMQKLDRCYTQILRCITQEHYYKDRQKPFRSNESFYAVYLFPQVRVRLAQERLIFAQRMTRRAAGLLKNLLEVEEASRKDSWMQALRDDVAWLISVQGTSWGEDLETIEKQWELRRGWKNFL